MHRGVQFAAGILLAAAVTVPVTERIARCYREEYPRNTTPIVVFDQGFYQAKTNDDPWALPGWDYGMAQHRSLATAGCHLISYAHCIQWVTGSVRGDALLSELLTVCKNPSDQAENPHRTACRGLHDSALASKAAYDHYLQSRYDIPVVEVEKTPEALAEFFRLGGAIVTFIPGHYISAVEMREVEGTLYVHIIDSNWGTACRKGYHMYFIDEEGNRTRILNTAEGTYTDGSDYWITYDLFSTFKWNSPLLPPGA